MFKVKERHTPTRFVWRGGSTHFSDLHTIKPEINQMLEMDTSKKSGSKSTTKENQEFKQLSKTQQIAYGYLLDGCNHQATKSKVVLVQVQDAHDRKG